MDTMFDINIDNEKQYINLSDEAWVIVDDDMRNFYMYDNKTNFSGFMNTVFINFYEQSDATFSSRCEEYRAELETIFGTTIPNKTEITEILIRDKLNRLKKATKSYPKGEGRKFRLNIKSQDILSWHPDSDEYDNRGDYIKAVFEQYATLPSYKRELVYFKQKADTIKAAIARNKQLRITLMPIKSVSNETSTAKYSIKPYAIRQDKTKTFNYLIGLSRFLDDKNTPVTNEKITCFRLSRICDIKLVGSAFISKEKRDEIEQTIKQKGVQFMSGDLSDIKVKFTQKGFDDFNRQTYMRPQYYEKIGKLTYMFHCTEFQAISYFSKFGGDAIIISPEHLHESLSEKYKNALEAYTQNQSD